MLSVCRALALQLIAPPLWPGWLAAPQVREYVKQLAELLSVLHRKRIVHGHLNPHEVIVSQGNVSLRDLCDCYVLERHGDRAEPSVDAVMRGALSETKEGQPERMAAARRRPGAARRSSLPARVHDTDKKRRGSMPARLASGGSSPKAGRRQRSDRARQDAVTFSQQDMLTGFSAPELITAAATQRAPVMQRVSAFVRHTAQRAGVHLESKFAGEPAGADQDADALPPPLPTRSAQGVRPTPSHDVWALGVILLQLCLDPQYERDVLFKMRPCDDDDPSDLQPHGDGDGGGTYTLMHGHAPLALAQSKSLEARRQWVEQQVQRQLELVFHQQVQDQLIDSDVVKNAKDLLEWCLDFDPAQRPQSMAAVLSHKFLKPDGGVLKRFARQVSINWVTDIGRWCDTFAFGKGAGGSVFFGASLAHRALPHQLSVL